MKKIVILIVSCILCLIMGYNVGIQNATTSNGWYEYKNETSYFILEVDGQLYEWYINEYN